jgi:para-nitrobenzyl esterase
MRAGQIRLGAMAVIAGLALSGVAAAQVKTTGGLVRGTTVSGTGIRVFKGVPFAAPPLGDLRWQAPRPVVPWEGVRTATEFGPRCTQGRMFSDISFTNLSEDCLSLNIWTPAKKAGDRLPVMVWVHGGGFQAGSGAEPRHDGMAFARKGIVLVTVNYRLGVFGFFSHPELTRESGRHASGNYGFLDQVAALRWVHDNITAFGGDPKNVTIFGESAGSFSVSALMASPLAKGLFHKAIGESGAFFTAGSGTLPLASLAASEERGVKFAGSLGAASLAALRAKPAADILAAASKAQPGFMPNLDGYFFPVDVWTIFAAGWQHPVPLLAGWNADEVRQSVTLRPQKPTVQSFTDDVRTRFGDSADAILRVYPASTDAEALESAAAAASDMFIGQNTWKWIEMHLETGGSPVYRYSFDRKIPVPPDNKVMGVAATSADIGARHAGEIEYVFGALELSRPKVPWEPADRKLSDAMTTYWANFARTGNPNGAGLPKWPRYQAADRRVMHLDAVIKDTPDTLRERYLALDDYMTKLRYAPPAPPPAPAPAPAPTPAPAAQPTAKPAAPQAPQQRTVVPRFATRQIMDDLYQIVLGGDMVSMYVLVGRDKALVVDTNTVAEYDGVKIIERVKAITSKPLIVVNTHPHGDHTAANAQFGEAYLSAAGVEEVKAGAAKRGVELGYVPKPVAAGHLFDLGDRQVEVIPIPAHSRGSIALFDRKAGYLFTGDEIDPGQVVGIHEGNVKQHHDNMRMLYEKYYKRISVLVPAHNGAPVTKRYIKYFMDLDARIMAGTAPVVPTGDGPNFNFPTNDRMVRYRENGAAVIYTKK